MWAVRVVQGLEVLVLRPKPQTLEGPKLPRAQNRVLKISIALSLRRVFVTSEYET